MLTANVVFKDEDLLFLLSVLMPGTADASRMLRIMREDEEILDGMAVLGVSPALFFAILLARVASDLTRQSFTFERSHGQTMALFDAGQVLRLLEDRPLRTYLTDMLVSFVRINSFSTSVRVRRGVWRKVRFSDFDIDHLLRYGSEIDESRRFPVYKRIADICLFTLGVFAPTAQPQAVPLPFPEVRSMRAVLRSREDYIAQGTSFYTLASRHREARARQMSDVLSTLAEKITLAAKPLSVMSARYLQPLKESPAGPDEPRIT